MCLNAKKMALMQWTTKALIRLRACAVWSGLSLSAYSQWFLWNLRTNKDGPGQSVRMRRLIWAFSVGRAGVLLRWETSTWSLVLLLFLNNDKLNRQTDSICLQIHANRAFPDQSLYVQAYFGLRSLLRRNIEFKKISRKSPNHPSAPLHPSPYPTHTYHSFFLQFYYIMLRNKGLP